MKIKNIFIGIILTGGLLFAACNSKRLDTVPQDSVIDATAFSTSDRIYAQLLSLYSSLKSGQLYGGRAVIYGDIKADQFINQTNNSVTGYDVWTGTATNSSTSIENLWAQAYLTINKCNIFIQGVDSLGTGIVTTDEASQYIAEAKFIRALCYSKLLEYYAYPYAYGSGGGSNLGVPLRLTAIVGGGYSDLARSTVAEVYTQILSDLDDAESDLPTSYSSDYDNTTRAHMNTAIALKTRIYLNMQDYANVVTEANKIVSDAAPFAASSGVANTLESSISTVFASPYTSLESIFSMPMTTTSGDYPGTQAALAYYFSKSVGNGEFSVNTSGIYADATWTSTDDRRDFIVSYTSGSSTTYWLSKYPTASPYTDYVPVIRYSEVLLNLSEALVRSTSSITTRAVALLNAVRNRSDASTTYTTSSFSSTSTLIEAILKERTIEFLGEGMRNGDLMRLVQTIPAKGAVGTIAAGASNYIWPIPATELSLNKLAVDN
ncbi:MAG: RagB/SusD family nutrient uptake outer membrane protein [Chitinophagaceae bacterium]